MKDVKAVKEEIVKLKDMAPNISQKTIFGDDNRAAIDAQIRVLEEDMDEDAIYDEWPELEGDMHVRDAAMVANDWRNEEGDDVPSEDWSALVQ